MMTKPILAILLLLPLSVGAGELDGKALVCNASAPSKDSFDDIMERYSDVIIVRTFGYRFVDGVAIRDDVIDTGSEITIAERDRFSEWNGDYSVTRTRITWGLKPSFELDRRTLELRRGNSTDAAKCELEASMDAYKERLNRSVLEAKKQASEVMKENRI